MNKRVILRRIFHRDKWRIAICFDFDEKLKGLVKSINGCLFSSTYKCFYTDDTDENLKLILRTLRDYADIDINALTGKSEGVIPSPDSPVRRRAGSLRAIAPVSDEDEDAPEEFFDQEIPVEVSSSSQEIQAGVSINDTGYFGPVEFRISEKEGLLVIRFLGKYDPAWIEEMKTYGKCYYDFRRREWLLQWSKLTCDSLADYFSGMRIPVNVKKQVINEELIAERKDTGEKVRSRALGTKALNGLDSMAMYLNENRYSPRTRETYLSLLEFFFRYFSDRNPLDITEE